MEFSKIPILCQEEIRKCVVPENIHTPTLSTEGIMTYDHQCISPPPPPVHFPIHPGIFNPFCGGVWMFFGTTQWKSCSSRKYPYPPHGRSTEIPRGWGVSKAKIFKGKYGAKLEFPEGWGDSNQKTFCGRGMDIFWN